MAKGIRRHGAGWQAEVRVVGHPRAVEQFPLETPPATMQAWRKGIKRQLQTTKAYAGTFAADARDYLRARQAMPGIRERTRHVALWVDAFGERPRASIKGWEISAIAQAWLLRGPKLVWRPWSADGDPRHGGRRVGVEMPLSASQVNKRLRALENLWTVLDGRHAPNPVRDDVTEPTEPDEEPRGLSYDVVEAILAAMPERRHARVLTPDAVAAIQSEPKTSASVLARSHGVSETMIRKIRAGAHAEDTPALTVLRLRVIAYVGLSHGELRRVRSDDLHLEDTPPWLFVAGRRKGAGTKGTPQPLTREGAAALRALVAAGGLGAFSHSSMWKSFQRACGKLGLVGLRPYDLRHSFASAVLERTGNLAVTQLLMRQKHQRTTLRYGKRAVSPVLAAALEHFALAGGFAPGNAPEEPKR